MRMQGSLGKTYSLEFFRKRAEYLKALGLAATDGAHSPSLVITELVLPDGSFLDVLKKKSEATVPFLILTKLQRLDGMRASFDRGALDYLLLPFSMNLLGVKVDRFLEKTVSAPSRVPYKSGLHLDSFALSATAGGSSVQLTLKEFNILSLLSRNDSQGVSRTAMFNEIWKTVKVGKNTLDVHLFNLRRKLEGLGYEVQYGPALSYALTRRPH